MSGSRPDHGYAYVIGVASFFGHFIIYGITFSLGLFYVEFRETFYENKGAVALISSLNTASVFFAGPVASFFTNRYGPRAVCCAGGVTTATGFVCSLFAHNIYILYLTFGLVAGFGLGLCFIPVVTILAGYFVKKRNVALGVAVCGGGVGNLSLAPLLQFLISLYGWRGSCLILGGLALNLCVIGAVLRPIGFHTEKYIDNTKRFTKETTIETCKADIISTPELLKKHAPGGNAFDVCESLVSLHTIGKGIGSTNLSNMNLFILKDTNFLLLCLNNFAVMFGVVMTLTHLPAFSVSCGHSAEQSALLIAFFGIGNIAGRLIVTFIAHVSPLSEMSLYVIVFFLCGIGVAVTTAMSTYVWIAFIALLFGNLYGTMGPLLPQVIIKILDLPLLVSGFGYLLLFGGLGTAIGPPIAELLFDYTGVYHASFCLAGAMLFTSSLFMVYPWWKVHSEHASEHSDMQLKCREKLW